MPMGIVAGQLARQARPSAGGVSVSSTCNAVKSPLRHVPRQNQPAGQVPSQPSFVKSHIEPIYRAASSESDVFWQALCGQSQPQALLLLENHEPVSQDLRPLLWRYQGKFEVQLNEPPAPPGQNHADYYANVGDAIRTLREDIPLLFNKDLNCE